MTFKFKFKDSNILPLSEVSSQDIKHLNSRTLNAENTFSAKPLKVKNSSYNVEERHLAIFKHYLKRICSGRQSCILDNIPYNCAKCILDKNAITACKFDNTLIYYFQNQIIYITKNAIETIPALYQSLDSELSSIFHESDLDRIKSSLFNNPLLQFITKHFSGKYTCVDANDMHDILRIILSPSGKTLNPLIIKNLKQSTYGIIENNIVEGNDWAAELKRTLNTNCIPQRYIEKYNEIYHKPINCDMLFNNTREQFLEACLPEKSANDIHEILCELNKTFPFELLPTDTPKINKLIDLICTQKFYIFQLFRPTQDELMSIFYFHQKPYLKNTTNILYNDSTNTIHYAILRKLLDYSNITRNIIAQYSLIEEQLNANIDLLNTYKEKLSLPPNFDNLRLNLSNCISQNLTEVNSINNEAFSRLRNTLFCMFQGDIDSVDYLAKLISKIYLGRDLFSEITHTDIKNSTNVTIIYSSNINYVYNFFLSIFNYSLIQQNIYTLNSSSPPPCFSTCTLKELSDPNNLPSFIINKLYGNIINIAKILSDQDIPQDLSQFKKISAGSRISISNKINNEITYQSNAHYIFITNKFAIDKNFTDIPHDCLNIDGNLENIQYTPLHSYENLFLILGFLNYTIDTCFNGSSKPSQNLTQSKQTTSLEQLIDTFIINFCDDTTNTILLDELNKIPLQQIPKSDKNKERKELGEKYHINKLQGFAINEDIHYAFQQWLNTQYHSSISQDDLIRKLLEKYHDLFYIKKTATNHLGLKKEYRGFCGINIKWDKLNAYIQENISNTNNKNNHDKELAFTHYLENLINKYMPQEKTYNNYL